MTPVWGGGMVISYLNSGDRRKRHVYTVDANHRALHAPQPRAPRPNTALPAKISPFSEISVRRLIERPVAI